MQEYIQEHNLIRHCDQMGKVLVEQLQELKDISIVNSVRGKGLLCGIDFSPGVESGGAFDPEQSITSRVVQAAFERGLLVMPGAPGPLDGVNGDHIAISPPFIINLGEIAQITDTLKEAIKFVERTL